MTDPLPRALEPSGPRDGDVVVSPAGERWGVGVHEGHAQVSFATEAGAIGHGQAFARVQEVDVWLCGDDSSYTRVASYARNPVDAGEIVNSVPAGRRDRAVRTGR